MEQLRFDILEKIRLHPQQSGIGSLLELDLYPDVEIKDEGQHLKIQGYLRLNGSYEGDLAEEIEVSDAEYDDYGNEEIAYVIPVEITLPRERAELAFVSAEVESFDYQLLSPFELQIEAVLMIDGILPEQEKENELVTEISDEIKTYENEANEQEPYEADYPSFSAEPAKLEKKAEKQEEVIQQPTPDHSKTIQDEVEKPFAQEIQRTTHVVKEKETHAPEEDQEIPALKVEENELYEELDANPGNTEEEAARSTWSSWLVGNKEDSLVPLKMVIVQKEDSIDTLAAKYDTSCAEILHLNQFQTDQLNEGQIVKIPLRQTAEQ